MNKLLEKNGRKTGPFILEKKVELAYEMSVVFARDESGKVVILSTQKNHQDGPLITSVSGP